MMKNLTICAVDCIVPELASNALKKCKEHIVANRVILFTDIDIAGDHDLIKINKLDSISSYNNFMLTELWKYIDTDFVLIVQWDGYIVDGRLWREEFLDYDYIGAVWPQFDDDYRVGNGGFSLRSKKLLHAISNSKFVFDENESEDILICRLNRKYLEEEYLIKFADENVANVFSYEQSEPKNNTFGFHGLWNLWRHENDDALIRIFKTLPKYYFTGYLIDKTVMNLYLQNRMKPFYVLFKKIHEGNDLDYLKNVLIFALKFKENDVKKMIKAGRAFVYKEQIFDCFTNFLSQLRGG